MMREKALIFGKIEYLNLLPFHIFAKRYLSAREQQTMHYKRGVPSKINNDFAFHRVDAAFISSIKAHNRRFVGLGIIANKEVRSVLIKPQSSTINDQASATSNVLSCVLGLQGEVIIGDAALRYALTGGEKIDLAEVWHERTGLPFVFALLCYHRHTTKMQKMAHAFGVGRVFIPQYLLLKASKRSGIAPKDIIDYLQLISYKVDHKALMSVKKFWKLSRAYR